MHVCFFNMYFNFIYFSNSYSLISFWFLVMLQQDPIDTSGYFLLMGLSWINSQYLLSLPASLLLLCVCLTLILGLIPQRIKRSPLSLRCLGSLLGSSLFPTNKLSGVMQWTQAFPAYWSTYYNRDDRYTASAVPDLNVHFHFLALKVVDLLCFFFYYPCIKRASYIDNEALHPPLLFQHYNIRSIIIIIIIRKQDWRDEDSKWIYTAWGSKSRIHVEDKC